MPNVMVSYDTVSQSAKNKLLQSVLYLNEEEQQLVEHACDYAFVKHDGQTRKSGEPYITHPIAVATEVASWKLDAKTIVSALLHDVLEDTGTTKAELASEFDETVAAIVDGLSKLEYRGYDSAGIAIRDKEIKIYKAKGKIANLKEKIKGKKINGTCGIGHTRWATHGEPSENNAHPHISNDGNVTLVHNGIIENYQELTKKLAKHGYHFYSETDTEILANIIDYYYKKYKMGPVDAINRMMVRVRGSYAIAVMFKEYPDEIWVARKDSPMILGKNEDGVYLASDVPAILKYTKDVYYIDNLEAACLKKDQIIFYDRRLKLVRFASHCMYDKSFSFLNNIRNISHCKHF